MIRRRMARPIVPAGPWGVSHDRSAHTRLTVGARVRTVRRKERGVVQVTTGSAVLSKDTGAGPGGLPARGGESGAGREPVRGDDAGPRRLPVLAMALAFSWLVPLGLDLVHLDVVLLPVLVLGVGSLLRVGGGLLDRVVVAAFVVCGAVMGLGLLFSVWPWGLAPVPGVGLMLTILSFTGWLARRRPSLPRRFRGSDLLVVGTGAVMWHYLHHPLIGKSAAERLGYFLSSEDRMGHFSYFDGIHQVGGYAFLHQEAARSFMMTPAEAVYPQGSHFLLAWIDVLVRSSTDAGPGLGAVNRYFLYVLAANALLCAAMVWAARWIGGPRLRGWRSAAVCATVAGLLLPGLMLQLVQRGFDSEIVGLLFLAVAVALLVRPAMRTAEFALVSAAALITVSYVYNLYGVLVGVALLATSVVHRRRFARWRWRLYAGQVAALAVAALPSVLSVLSKLDVAKTSNLAGPMAAADRVVLIGCALAALLAAALPKNRRTGSGQAVLLTLLGVAATLAVFGWWQMRTIGYYSYYFEKLAMAGMVIAMIGLGTVGLLLDPAERTRGPRIRRRLDRALLSGLATAAALSLFGYVQWGVPSPQGPLSKAEPSAYFNSATVKWGKGGTVSNTAAATRTFATRDLARVPSGHPVITLYGNDGYQNLNSTFMAQLLTRQAGAMVGLYETYYVKIGGPAQAETDYQEALAHLRSAVASCSTAPTVLVGDPAVAARLRHDLADGGSVATVLDAPLG